VTHERLAAAWAADKPALGGWVMSPSMRAVYEFAWAGYDFVGIDTQHALLDENQAGVLLQPLVGSATATAVRVTTNEPHAIGKVLDAGADIVIVPLIATADDAAAAVAACRFPPAGERSMGPMHPALARDAAASLEDRVSLFLMLESMEAMENVDELCATPGIAGIYIGPVDLAVSCGKPRFAAFVDPPDSELGAVIERAGEAARRHGVVPGIHAGSGAMAAYWAARGFRFMCLSADTQLIAEGAARELEIARR
jgi:4-hydroxy-2-oxoheptanedioate aldolase